MRFKARRPVCNGEKRSFIRFAWWPHLCQGEWIWLQKVVVFQTYHGGYADSFWSTNRVEPYSQYKAIGSYMIPEFPRPEE